MKKLFAVNKYVPVALALGALAAAGSAPAFAHFTLVVLRSLR